ncbi:hypothetical protein NEIFL0001_2181 [Neisseria flavescens SK114]|nr:hypothetical protein NEIFL0001_2181 [Neisseria flavescens SK114]
MAAGKTKKLTFIDYFKINPNSLSNEEIEDLIAQAQTSARR